MKLKRTLLGLLAVVFAGAALAQTVLPPFITGTETTYRQSVFEIGFLRVMRNTALTATPSGTLANSQVLNLGMNRFATVATGGDAATLPTLSGGIVVFVVNDTATAMNVFPNSATAQINNGGAGTAFSLTANKKAMFIQADDGKWFTIPATP